jgi:hypothetical protein
MQQQLECKNLTDDQGNPAGGSVFGSGVEIAWQGGAGRGADRLEPNRAFVEDVTRRRRGFVTTTTPSSAVERTASPSPTWRSAALADARRRIGSSVRWRGRTASNVKASYSRNRENPHHCPGGDMSRTSRPVSGPSVMKTPYGGRGVLGRAEGDSTSTERPSLEVQV